ncbi:MAG: cell division ATP-binding protein FtsE [Ruminococcus sp.]|nr:cell division ATP-binding protein FtsE [Ruminococcus sp.]
MVELKNVSVTYSSGVDALNNVSLKINDGDFAFVVGSSGAGKSTMIKLLLKEIDATSGVVTVNGYNLNKLKKRKIPEFRRTLGFVFQDFRLIPSMTVYENIAFVLRVIDAPIKYIRKRVPYVISLVGLHAKTNSYPDELSGGEKQRVAIARALVNDPQLIIADEPTGNIDPELSYEIVELLKGINDQGTTILMVTHEHDLVRHFGGRIINITEGEIVFDEVITGTGDELLADMSAEMPAEAMAAAVSEAEHINDNVREDINTEDNIELPIENMTADDIISAIGGVPEPEKPEKEFMKPVKENIDVEITQELPKIPEGESPEEILAKLSDKTEGGKV